MTHEKLPFCAASRRFEGPLRKGGARRRPADPHPERARSTADWPWPRPPRALTGRRTLPVSRDSAARARDTGRVILGAEHVADRDDSSTTEGRASGVLRRLAVVHGAVSGGPSVLVLDGGPVVVGREAAEATLVLDDARVSRRHARFAADEGGWVSDLGSRNGVLVDGARRERAALRDGLAIRVGKSLLVYTEQELDGLSLTRAEQAPLRPEPRDGSGARGD